MTKLSLAKRAFGLFLFCAAAAIATPAQKFRTLYSFDGADGNFPYAGLVQGTNGTFYGATRYGGADSCGGGCGKIFSITPGGTLTTLYSFCAQTNCTDGGVPNALIQGARRKENGPIKI